MHMLLARSAIDARNAAGSRDAFKRDHAGRWNHNEPGHCRVQAGLLDILARILAAKTKWREVVRNRTES